MKKVLAGLTVLAFVCIASSAMAAGVKVPKTLCLSHLFEAKYYQLVIKSQGSIPTPDGTVKSYSITGHIGSTSGGSHWPVSGSAYVAPGSTTLHANFDGHYGAGNFNGSFYELFYNLDTNTGTLHWVLEFGSGGLSRESDPVTGIDCNDPSLTIPD